MRFPRIISAINLIIIVMHSSTAAGQVIPSAYKFIEMRQEVGAFAGKANLGKGQLGLDPSSASVVGVRWSLDVGSALSLEADGSIFLAERDVLDLSRAENDRVIGQSDMTIVLLDVRLRLNLTGHRTWHGIQPYVAFGAGIAGEGGVDRTLEESVLMPQDQRFDFGNRFTATLASGLSLDLSERFSLRADGLFSLWKMGTPTGWLTVDVDPLHTNPQGEWLAGKSVLFSIGWRY